MSPKKPVIIFISFTEEKKGRGHCESSLWGEMACAHTRLFRNPKSSLSCMPASGQHSVKPLIDIMNVKILFWLDEIISLQV